MTTTTLTEVINLDLVTRLHEFGLLLEANRLKAVTSIKRRAIEVPDSGFLKGNIRNLNDRR